MSIIFKEKRIIKILPLLLSPLNLILAIVLTVSPLIRDSDINIWNSIGFGNLSALFSTIFAGLAIFQGVVWIISFALWLFKKPSSRLLVTGITVLIAGAFLALQIVSNLLNGIGLTLIIAGLVSSLIIFIFALITQPSSSRVSKEESSFTAADFDSAAEIRPLNKKILLILSSLALFFVFAILATPLYAFDDGSGVFLFYVFTTYSSDGSLILANYLIFVAFAILIVTAVLAFANSFRYFFSDPRRFAAKTKQAIIFDLGITLAYFLCGYIIAFIGNLGDLRYDTLSFIPLIFSVIAFIGYNIYLGKHTPPAVEKPESKKEKSQKYFRFESLSFVVVLTALTFLTLLVNIVEIRLDLATYHSSVTMSGFQLLTDYNKLDGSLQVLSFVEFVFLLISGSFLILTVSGLVSKMRDYHKLVKSAAIVNVIMIFLLGISGLYFSIGQKINEEIILSILESFGITGIVGNEYSYTVSTQTIYLFAGSMVALIAMMARGHFNIPEENVLDLCNVDPTGQVCEPEKPASPEKTFDPVLENIKLYDVCPAFTEIDQKVAEFQEMLAQRKEHAAVDLTLPKLVSFIAEYARDSRLHLSYSPEDIATFIAGLGASRLSILQGMSGTGKTSLPKIFIEAIMGNCEIVEVESSWRDKNELLGYYNEFSKNYTPKKFTQSLYRARLNPEVPTFIVLDEMNLSRIEYYFSDFLSLMENEEDKREIKLLNVKLFRIEDGKMIEYSGLSEGHTIKIPTNVWFIGTANRDESTFEISDKVYDRAQTMNFIKRAPKIRSFQTPILPKFVSYEQISHLLAKAKNNSTFDIEEDSRVQEVEKLLSPYNISFGNRVLKQMEEFINIYFACLPEKVGVTAEAVEKILLSKVVSKLEFKNVEDKEELAQSFDSISLHACSAFIRKLNED